MLTLLSSGQGQSGTYVELMLQAYKLRVYAEAGVFEAEECLKASLNTLNNYQVDPNAQLVRNYATRVRADGGTVEAFESTTSRIKDLRNQDLYDRASFSLFPSGVKAGKAYSILPTNGAGDLTVVRNTTKTRTNGAGLIEIVAANVPSLNYDTVGGVPSVLVEPQRTNLILFSEEFENNYYVKPSTSVSANTDLSPSNNLTADKVLETATSSDHSIYRLGFNINEILTVSVFIKYLNKQWIGLNAYNGSNNKVWFDLINGQIGVVSTGVTAKIESLQNGWYRISASVLANNSNCGIGMDFANSNGGSPFYAGNTTLGYLLWGAQLEQGSYPTSYIPTTTSAVTRNADLVSKTGISDLIGQSEGTFFIEAKVGASASNNLISLHKDLFNDNRIFINFKPDSNAIDFFLIKNNAVQVTFSFSGSNISQNFQKIAFVYKQNNSAFFINGVKVGFNLICETYAANTLSILSFNNASGSSPFQGNVKSLQLYKTALTDAECITLTS
jgi:hypothetical protein